MSLEYFAKMILIIAGFAVIIWFMGNFLGFFSEKGIEETCRASIQIRQKLKIETNHLLLPDLDLRGLIAKNCKTQEIEVPRKETKNPHEQAKKEIADAMAKCWWMIGEGYYDAVLSPDKKLDAEGTVEDLCFVCYAVKIKEKAGEITLEELKNYLATTPYETGLLDIGLEKGAGKTLSTPIQEANTKKEELKDKSVTKTKLLRSPKELKLGIADLTGIISYDDKILIASELKKFYDSTGIETTIIIIPELEEGIENEKNLGAEIKKEWHLGDEKLNNNLVIIISIKEQKTQYYLEEGTQAIISSYEIEELITKVFEQEGTIKEKITNLIKELNQLQEGNGDINKDFLISQKSYASYISGGLANRPSEAELTTTGGIIISNNLKEEGSLEPGKTYAVVFVSTKNIKSFAKDSHNPSLIGLMSYEELSSSNNICMVVD